jgi:hypothetical protein
VTGRRYPLHGGAWALAALLFVASGHAMGQDARPSAAAASGMPTAEALKSCLAAERTAECLDRLFREALKSHSTHQALEWVAHLEATDADLRRDCHPIVHSIGRETFVQKGSIHDAFAVCDQTCHSGCYHGSVERFLRGDELYAQSNQHPSRFELQQKAVSACDRNTPSRVRYQCLHGLGHAIMFFSGYNLANALAVCDALGDDWSQNSCYGGVFMENVVNAEEGKANFVTDDLLAPCDRIEEKYRRECYGMQTSHMAGVGLSNEQILVECGKAGEFRRACAQSLGRDLSNYSRGGDHRAAATTCELATGELRSACVRGATYALVDTTWDGRYALPFCAAFAAPVDQDACLAESVDYLRTTFEKSSTELAGECSRYAPEPQRCLSALKR